MSLDCRKKSLDADGSEVPVRRGRLGRVCDWMYSKGKPPQADKARWLYKHPTTQKLVATLIMLNFLCTVCHAKSQTHRQAGHCYSSRVSVS